MKILCLNPPFKTEYGRFSRTSRSPAITKSGTIYYPIWLCYAAGVLEATGHKIQIIDSCAYKYDLAKTLKLITEFSPEVVVVDTSTPSIFSDIKTTEKIKGLFPNCFNVLIGTHPSVLPEETLRLSDSIDAIVVGEADYTLRELAQRLSDANLHRVKADNIYRKNLLSAVNGLAYRNGNEVFINKKRQLIDNLDELPFVSKVYKRHLDVRKYFFAACDYPEVQIITGRGCPYKCFFCVYPQALHERKYRFRSPKNVVEEFEYIIKNFPEVKEIGIEDDTFTADKKRTQSICKLILEKDLNIKWYCNVRFDLDLDTMKLMKEAGCVLITVGFESASQKMLNDMKKGISAEQIREFVKNSKKAGLLVHGCFMVGNPGETKETMEYNLEVAKELNCDTMQFFPLMLYPGTEAYDWARKNGYLRTNDYSNWVTEEGLHACIFDLPNLKAEEMVDFCDRARREYYLRLRYIMNKLRQLIFKPEEISRTWKSLKIFWKYLIRGSNLMR